MKVLMTIQTSYKMTNIKSLVDSGATNNFMHPKTVRLLKLGTKKLEQPKWLFNVDDTENKSGNVTHYVDLDVRTNNIHKQMRFLVSDIGREHVILGYPWLATFKPQFDWKNGVVHARSLPIILHSLPPWRQRPDERLLTVTEKEEVV